MRKFELRPLPGQEPKRNKADPALFDRCHTTKALKLFDDRDLPDTFEERQDDSKTPYTVERRKRSPRPFRGPTGEIVYRLRGGKGYTPIFAPWSPAGLLRVRGRLLLVSCPAEGGGRVLEWTDCPVGWGGVELDLPPPYVAREVVGWALNGADVSGCNIPGVRGFAERVLRANRLANLNLAPGPRIEEPIDGQRSVPFISFTGAIEWREAPAEVPFAVACYRAELQERKRFSRERKWVPGMPMHVDPGGKVRNSESRNETTGEYGPETKLTHDGRVALGFGPGGLPQLDRREGGTEGKTSFSGGVATRTITPPELAGVTSYTRKVEIRLANGKTKRVDAQMAATRVNRPGPKPQFGVTMDAATRQAKKRALEKGLPFVLEEYLRTRRVRETV